MFNKVRRHFNRIHNVRELHTLDAHLRADIGSPLEHENLMARRVLLLPLGPSDRTRA